MTIVLVVLHLLIAIALVGVILLQRSEGGGLGMGGGSSGGGFMTGRAAANALTRATAILAALERRDGVRLGSLLRAHVHDAGQAVLDALAKRERPARRARPARQLDA